MKVLGISAYYHDAAAALVWDGRIVAAAQEERFSRQKHDPSFPEQAIAYCLTESGLQLDQLDAIAFYDKPLLKFERLLETYVAYAPSGLRSFVKAMPVWLKEKMFLKRELRNALEAIGGKEVRNIPLLFPEHHLSHAASAFYPSPFSEAAILTVDGVGEWCTTMIAHGKGGDIKSLRELHFPHSLGLLYSAVTYYLGFRVNNGEYKVMGLAPYGNKDGEAVARFGRCLREELVHLQTDGSCWLNPAYFTYATGLRMTNDIRWKALFKLDRRKPEEPLEQIHCDLALAFQQFIEEAVLQLALTAKQLTGAENLCLAGGVALNCVANGKLAERGLFKHIFIQPAAGDAGGALGAALAAVYLKGQTGREITQPDAMQGACLGPNYSRAEIERWLRAQGVNYKATETEEELCGNISQALVDGKVVGWFQGRMEFGPRALGHRSILGDPRSAEMQRTINLKIKFRESFRPFAPIVLEEEAAQYFDLTDSSPYMLMVHQVKTAHQSAQPNDYSSWPMAKKLAHVGGDFPAITHVDGSARIQTVREEIHPLMAKLLRTFKAHTGIGMLVNTSFNVKDEPIVCTPADAYRCFQQTEMDVLALGPFILTKEKE